MAMIYPALLEVRDSGKYVARVPDVPGCVTSGRTIEEVFENVKDALAGCLCVLEDEDESLPTPSDPASVAKDGSTVILVEVDLLRYREETDTRAVRKNVSMPAWMATMADKHNLNCSQLLQRAIRRELQLTH